MQSGGTVGLNIGPLYLLYLILPGLVFVKAFLQSQYKPDTLDNYDRVGYALAGSTVSLLVILLLYKFCFYSGPEGELTANNIVSEPLVVLLSGVVAQCVIAAMFGAIVGGVKRWNEDVPRNFSDREQPWEYTSDEIRDEEVQIVLKDGSEVEGIVARYGLGAENGSVVLSPTIGHHQRHLEIGSEHSTDAAHIEGDAIMAIHFLDREEENEYENILKRGDLEDPEDQE